MIKYFCDACGKEIDSEWVNKMTTTAEVICRSRGGGSRQVEMHFHQKCLERMAQYLKRAAEEEQS